MSAAASAATALVANQRKRKDDRADIKTRPVFKIFKANFVEKKSRRGYDNGPIYSNDATVPRHQRKIQR